MAASRVRDPARFPDALPNGHHACVSGLFRERARRAPWNLPWELFFFSLDRKASVSRGSLRSLSGTLRCITSTPTGSSSLCWRRDGVLIPKTVGWNQCKRPSSTHLRGIQKCQSRSPVPGTVTTSSPRNVEQRGHRVLRVLLSAPLPETLARLRARTTRKVPVSGEEARSTYFRAEERTRREHWDARLDTSGTEQPDKAAAVLRQLLEGHT